MLNVRCGGQLETQRSIPRPAHASHSRERALREGRQSARSRAGRQPHLFFYSRDVDFATQLPKYSGKIRLQAVPTVRRSGRRLLDLLFVDLRSCPSDAAFYEISLNFELLVRAQVHHCVEWQVAG